MLKTEISKGTKTLTGRSCARLEAELLLGAVTGLNRLQLYLNGQTPVNRSQKSRYHRMLKRRKQGTPVAYLLQAKEFFSLGFQVGPGVLIPRPETETLIEAVLNSVTATTGNARLLDLGTGSGAICLTLARFLPHASFWATDKSPQALRYARRNAARLKVSSRINFGLGDWFEGIPAGFKFDAIISNPPYVSSSEWHRLERGIRRYEPCLALQAGQDGLRHYRTIIANSPKFLKPGGEIWLEIGCRQGRKVRALLSRNGFTGISILKDLSGKDRVITGKLRS